MEAWVIGTYDYAGVDLSEEVLVSDCCDAGDCQGGYINQAADWMVETGTTNEVCWPYSASNGPCYGYCGDPVIVRTLNWEYACGNWWTIDIDLIKQAIVEHGPLVTGMDVYSDFYNYDGGIYRHTYGSYLAGHAVLITGYVDDPDVPGGGFFIAKNSWGQEWGHFGYFAIAYDSNCNFGIESTYYYGAVIY
jgi:C1A family cysteine protease